MSSSIASLIPGRIEEGRTPYGADSITLTAPRGTATVLLQGGQVVDWTPVGTKPVLWMPERPVFAQGKATRGGIPICWPWFGAAAQPGQPSHGTVRQALWHLLETAVTADKTVLVLAPSSTSRPAGITLSLRITLAETLTLSLTHFNESGGDFSLSHAFHTYFAISDIAAIHIDGFDGEHYWDQLHPGPLQRQAGAIRFAGEVDRIYDVRPDMIRLVDPGNERTIEIEAWNSGTTVIWNPWAAKAERLGDLGADGWRRMVCIESSEAKPNRVTLRPGARDTTGVCYTVRAH
jgi:D-hexose-6-phosphate mutarotase